MKPKARDIFDACAMPAIGTSEQVTLGGRAESTHMITPRVHRRESKEKTIMATKRQKLSEIMPALPEPGSVYHVVSNGHFDYWTWVPVMLGYMGHATEFYGSTWTINRPIVLELLALIDAGTIQKASFITGTAVKRLLPAVHATMIQGLASRGMRYTALENHAKIALIGNEETDTWIVIEGSANWTANRRIEQNVVANDRGLYDFHREWMEECLTS